MHLQCLKHSAKVCLGLAVGLLAIRMLMPAGQAIAWLNVAQIQRLRGNHTQAMAAFARALALAPNNPHIRWQAGLALARAGDSDAAVTTLLPLAEEKAFNPDWADSLLAALLDVGREDEALRLYESVAEPPPLSSPVAAKLAYAYLQRTGYLPLSRARAEILLRYALAPDATTMPEGFKGLAEQVADTSFWSTDTGRRVRGALVWRSQSRVDEASSVVVEPDRKVVVEMLGLTPGDVEFGEELVVNGAFEQLPDVGRIPSAWKPWFRVENTANRAIFVAGADGTAPFAGNYALRIDGLQIERLPEREGARAGLMYAPIVVTSGKPYVISFVYRTEGVVGEAADVHLPSLLAQYLPATQGQWKRVTIVVWNRTDGDMTTTPMMRLWSEGSVWYDDFSIRQVTADPQSLVSPQDVLVRIDDAVR